MQWLTVPVRVRENDQTIRETEIDDTDWAEAHWKSTLQNYRKAPHFEEIAAITKRYWAWASIQFAVAVIISTDTEMHTWDMPISLHEDLSPQLISKTMRLTNNQIQAICQLVSQVAGNQSCVRVFGSRLDDTAHGGDLDLMLELTESVDNPALMAAQLSALVSRAMSGRKVDVLLSAPNLMRLPIHDIAFQEGQLL